MLVYLVGQRDSNFLFYVNSDQSFAELHYLHAVHLVGQRDSIHELLIRLKSAHWFRQKAHVQINASSSFTTRLWWNFPIKFVCIPTAKCHCYPHSKFSPIHVEPGWTCHRYTVWVKKPSRLQNKRRWQPGIKNVAHNFVSEISHSLMQLPCRPREIKCSSNSTAVVTPPTA